MTENASKGHRISGTLKFGFFSAFMAKNLPDACEAGREKETAVPAPQFPLEAAIPRDTVAVEYPIQFLDSED